MKIFQYTRCIRNCGPTCRLRPLPVSLSTSIVPTSRHRSTGGDPPFWRHFLVRSPLYALLTNYKRFCLLVTNSRPPAIAALSPPPFRPLASRLSPLHHRLRPPTPLLIVSDHRALPLCRGWPPSQARSYSQPLASFHPRVSSAASRLSRDLVSPCDLASTAPCDHSRRSYAFVCDRASDHRTQTCSHPALRLSPLLHPDRSRERLETSRLLSPSSSPPSSRSAALRAIELHCHANTSEACCHP